MAVSYNAGQTPLSVADDTVSSPEVTSYAADTGSDRLVILLVGMGGASGGGTASAVDWGGQAGTKIGTVVTNSNWVSQEAFYFTEAQIAARSNDTVSITHNGTATQMGIVGFTLTGVHQTTPITSIQTGSGSAATAQSSASVSSTSDGLVIGLLMTDSEGINTSTAHSHTSITYTSVINSDTLGAGQRTAGTGGSINPTWTQPSEGYAVKTFNVDAATGSGTAIPAGSMPWTGRVLDLLIAMANDARIVIRKA